MKKYIILGLSVALAVFSTTSCNQKLLDIPQKGVIAYEDFYQTDEDAESALTAEVEHDGTLDRLPGVLDAIEGLRRSDDATLRWGRFKRQAYYAGDASWQDVLDSVEALLQAAIP